MSMTDPGPTPPKRSKPSSDETGKCDIPGRPVHRIPGYNDRFRGKIQRRKSSF